MEISEFQKIIWETYKHHDQKRGLRKTFNWFKSEVKELEEAINNRDIEQIKEEIADVYAWLTSLANLLDIDTENIIEDKYGKGCPKCKNKPCTCVYRGGPS